MNPHHKISVLIADDHLVVRMGLATLLGVESDITVVGEASNGDEAVRLAKQLAPDVVIMDLMMPRMNGVEATAEIRRLGVPTQVLILTTFGESADIRRALDAGAVGAIIKDSGKALLVDAIRSASVGERIISPEIAHALSNTQPLHDLTSRQTEILQLVANGLNNREISDILGIGRDCVKAHLKTIFNRLEVSSRSEAVAIALREKLLDA